MTSRGSVVRNDCVFQIAGQGWNSRGRASGAAFHVANLIEPLLERQAIERGERQVDEGVDALRHRAP